LRKNLFYSTVLLTLANLLMRAISMAFQVYLSGQVGAAGIGLLQLILTVSALAVTIGTAGVRVSLMYLCAEELGHRRPGGVRSAMGVCLLYTLAFSTLCAFAMMGLADRLAEGWIGDVRSAPALRLAALLLPLTCLNAVMTGYFTAASKIGRMVIVDIFERVLSIFLTVWLLKTWAKGDLTRACCAMVGGNALSTAVGFFLLYGLYRLDRRSMHPVKEKLHMPSRLFKLCIPLAVNEYLRAGLGTLEQMLIPKGLAKAAGSTMESMAAYGTIHGMVFPILFFPTCLLYSLSDLLVPELAKCLAAKRQKRIVHLTDKCLRLCFFYACAIAGGLYCLAPQLGQLLFGTDEVGIYLRMFAPQVLVLYLDAIVDGMNKGLGQQVICVRYNTFTSILDVVLLFFLLPVWGIGGYYFSFTVTHLINLFLSIRRLIKVSGYRPSLGFACKSLFLTGLCCVLTSLITPALPQEALTGLLAVLLAFVLLFWTFTNLLHPLSKEDFQWLKSIILPKGQKKSVPIQ